MSFNNQQSGRDRLHEVIFEADTPAGKLFDVVLLLLIVASVLTVILESMENLREEFLTLFLTLEWTFTILFTIEYLLRVYAVKRPMRYILSYWGLIDLFAVLPTYLTLIISGSQYFLVIRAFRLMRIFRIFKLNRYTSEGLLISQSLKASRLKIGVFLFFVSIAVIIIGALLHMVEGGVNEGFSSIPKGIYWAIVTLTTVGYGDISPITGLGQFLAAAVMILGYSILAVPTGIVSAEMINAAKKQNTQNCRYCARSGHDDDADFCKYCGEKL